MSPSQTTSTLLESLRSPHDDAAWRRFDARYRPVLIDFARSLGLDPHDAEDIAQKASMAFCKAHREGKYARTGRLKNWLLTVAHNEIADFCAERARRPLPTGQRTATADILATVRDPDTISTIWERQWQAHAVRECLRRASTQFSPRDMRVFESLTLEGRTVDDVAEATSLSRDAVYQVKHRVLAYLCQAREELESGG